ncbi:MAG: UbiX family flavin prenyltransferase [Halanaerobiales bacterium]|nr:UbiX family flavin prenyltransferase [Halanaerobiales bacterium]
MKRFIVGITGATGSIYGMKLVEELIKMDYQVYLTITKAGIEVITEELKLPIMNSDDEKIYGELLSYLSKDLQMREIELKKRLCYIPINRVGASIASGSFLTEGMAVLPCSMSTLSGIAHGRSMNLLERTADVMLKEGRPLLISPREMPLNTIHLENMLKLSKLGVMIVPPMPGFYYHPETIDDMVNFVVGKILDRLRIPHELFQRWGEK